MPLVLLGAVALKAAFGSSLKPNKAAEKSKSVVSCNVYPNPESQIIYNHYPLWRGEPTWQGHPAIQADELRQWYHFDAEGKTLGHLAHAVCDTVRGKTSTLYAPNRDYGAYVVVTNCEKIRVTGKKFHYKLYFRNVSKRPGSMKVERFKDLQRRFPERILMHAVWGFMPKTPTMRRIFKERLKLFTGPYHLYYHMDPVEYPMHLIRDCTPTQNIRRAKQYEYQYDKVLPRVKAYKEEVAAKEAEKKLASYKTFLRQQIEDVGPEAAERMKFDELVKRGDELRVKKVLEENIGKDIPEPKPRTYGDKLWNMPRRKASDNVRW